MDLDPRIMRMAARARTVKALVITGHSTREWAFCDVRTDLDSLQTIVGGSIQCLSFAGLELICNEEGKNEGLPLTLALCERVGQEVILHDIIAGPVIVHGSIDNRNDGAMLGLEPLQEAALKYWRDLDWRSGLRSGLAVTVDGPFIRPNMPRPKPGQKGPHMEEHVHVGQVKRDVLCHLKPLEPLRRVYMVPAGTRATSASEGLWWADPHAIKMTGFDQHDAIHYGLIVPADAIEHSAATCWCHKLEAAALARV